MQKSSEQKVENYKKLIDLEKVIYEKNPRLQKLLPRFLINFIKWIVHEDEINDFVFKHRHLSGVDFARAVVEQFNLKISIVGEENIPLEGRKFIASNHPLGGPDGVALISLIGKYRRDIKFIVNDILWNIENLRPVFIPVNKVGANTKSSVNLLETAYAGNELMLTFPFGLVSRRINGKIMDLEWKKNFISKAKEYKRDIVPVHISGRNSYFFYYLANIRKKLGIKANIEMFFLPNEMFSLKDRDITITFGKHIPHTMLNNSHTDQQWAEKLRHFVYELEKNPAANFTG